MPIGWRAEAQSGELDVVKTAPYPFEDIFKEAIKGEWFEDAALSDAFIDSHAFYVNLDVNFILDNFKADVAFLRRVWAYPGRPTFLLPVHQRFLKLAESEAFLPSIVTTIKKLKSGYINGTRVVLGKLKQFESTSCIRKITFIKSADTLIRRQSSIRSASRRRRLTV
ncbi:unnamed protein product, partial [Dibothriocephalus latus]